MVTPEFIFTYRYCYSLSEEGYAACARSGRGKNKVVLAVVLSVLSGKFGTVRFNLNTAKPRDYKEMNS